MAIQGEDKHVIEQAEARAAAELVTAGDLLRSAESMHLVSAHRSDAFDEGKKAARKLAERYVAKALNQLDDASAAARHEEVLR